MYAKEAYILWRDPKPNTTDLIRGRRGKVVDEFKSKLRQLGRIASTNTTDDFDVETATAVSQIQSESGLVLDSIAGEQVRMVVGSWLEGSDFPRLDPDYAATRGGAAVAAAAPAPAPATETTATVQRSPIEPVGNAPASKKAAPKPEPVEDENSLPTSIPAPIAAKKPETAVAAATKPEPEPEPAPAPAPAPQPEPAPAPAEEQAPPSADAQVAGEAAASAASSPVQDSTAPDGDPGVVKVQNLPDPVEGAFVPDTNDARKETTPPVNGSAPLVPAE